MPKRVINETYNVNGAGFPLTVEVQIETDLKGIEHRSYDVTIGKGALDLSTNNPAFLRVLGHKLIEAADWMETVS